MAKYEADDINFHGFLGAMRKFRGVTLEHLSNGLCSVSMLNRIEQGKRFPDKLTRDRIIARLGVSGEGYEDYLGYEEYQEWVLRQDIFKSIEENNMELLENYLLQYAEKEGMSNVELQFLGAMRLIVLRRKGASLEEERALIEKTVKYTVPVTAKKFPDYLLLSEQELYLLTEYVYTLQYTNCREDEFHWRLRRYEKLREYLKDSELDKLAKAKVYPKTVCCMCEWILEQTNAKELLLHALEVCNEAIELLRDTRKMYYFIELLEFRIKLIEQILKVQSSENNHNEIQMLYENKNVSVNKTALLEQLEEAKTWHQLFMDLYNTYGVSPYMKHFCHVYWETESYCVADIIRIRREMFGMSLRELSEGVCSVKTLRRLEQREVKTQMAIVRELFKKLGLCAEYIRARVVTSEHEVLQLYETMTRYANNRDVENWEKCLIELKSRLNMDIAYNRQMVMRAENLLELKKGHITQEIFKEKINEVLECTLPLKYVAKENYLTREEKLCIYSIAIQMNNKINNEYMTIMKEICKRYEKQGSISAHISMYELFINGIISHLGTIREYKESDRLGEHAIREFLVHRRMGNIAYALFNEIWNYKQRVAQGIDAYIEYDIKERLKSCIILSEINKADKLKSDFEDKLANENYNK